MIKIEERNAHLANVAMWVFIIAICFLTVYLAYDIIAPLILAGLYSVVVLRFVDFLEVKTFLNRSFSIGLVLVVSILLLSGLLFLLGNQVVNYFDDLPAIEKNLDIHLSSFQNWIATTFQISRAEQDTLVQESTKEPTIQIKQWLLQSNIFSSFSNTIMNITLIPIYSFLLMLYKRRIKKFLYSKYGKNKEAKLTKILNDIKSLINYYLSGLLLQMIVVFALSLIGFWIVGAPHAIFLSLLCALMNLIPYVGILFAGLISVLSTLTAQNEMNSVIGVIIVIAVVQLIENNFISPKIVGSKVRLNPLATILAIIIGGSLAGIAGMFLAIPLLAIVNIIIQQIDALRAYSYLISDTDIEDLEAMEND